MKIESTENQRRFIANLIEQRKDDHLYLEQIIKETPTHNEKYPDERVNNINSILADRLKNLTYNQADYIIKAFKGEKGYKSLTARNIIIDNIIK